jgi:hypothetical protein
MLIKFTQSYLKLIEVVGPPQLSGITGFGVTARGEGCDELIGNVREIIKVTGTFRAAKKAPPPTGKDGRARLLPHLGREEVEEGSRRPSHIRVSGARATAVQRGTAPPSQEGFLAVKPPLLLAEETPTPSRGPRIGSPAASRSEASVPDSPRRVLRHRFIVRRPPGG